MVSSIWHPVSVPGSENRLVVIWICYTGNNLAWCHSIIPFSPWALALHTRWNLVHHSKYLAKLIAINPYIIWGHTWYHQVHKKVENLSVTSPDWVNWGNLSPITSTLFLVVKSPAWLFQVTLIWVIFLPIFNIMRTLVSIWYDYVSTIDSNIFSYFFTSVCWWENY